MFNDLMQRRLTKHSADDDDVRFNVQVEVLKTAPLQFFMGWATVCSIDGQPVIDNQGDIVDDTEMERYAHEFMRTARLGKVMHTGGECIDYVVSMPFTEESKAALGITMTPDKSGWVVGGYARDLATWQRIKDGELRALSIGGTGVRTLIDTQEITKTMTISTEAKLAALDKVLIREGLSRPGGIIAAVERAHGLTDDVAKSDAMSSSPLICAIQMSKAAKVPHGSTTMAPRMRRDTRPIHNEWLRDAADKLAANRGRRPNIVDHMRRRLAKSDDDTAPSVLVRAVQMANVHATASNPTSADMLAQDLAWSARQGV